MVPGRFEGALCVALCGAFLVALGLGSTFFGSFVLAVASGIRGLATGKATSSTGRKRAKKSSLTALDIKILVDFLGIMVDFMDFGFFPLGN